MKVYYTVSHDKYELITAIADSSKELASMLGVEQKTVLKGVERYEKGIYNSQYRRITIDE